MKDAEFYVKIYCDYGQAAIRNYEIALEAPNILTRLIEHEGELPQGSGYFHDTLIGRIDKMKRIHEKFSNAMSLLRLITEKQRWCAIAWECHMHRLHEMADGTERTLNSGREVAEYLNVDYECFRKQRQRGLDRINQRLEDLRNAENGVFIA